MDLPLFAVGEIERAAQHVDTIARTVNSPGRVMRLTWRYCMPSSRLTISFLLYGHARLEVDHPTVNRRRQLPDLAVDTAAHLGVEIETIDNQHNAQQHENFYHPTQQAPSLRGGRDFPLCGGITFSSSSSIVILIRLHNHPDRLHSRRPARLRAGCLRGAFRSDGRPLTPDWFAVIPDIVVTLHTADGIPAYSVPPPASAVGETSETDITVTDIFWYAGSVPPGPGSSGQTCLG